MSTILDTDLFLTQRGAALYHVTAADLKKEAPPNPWTPADMATLLWLDASDANNFTLRGDVYVIQWDDTSGNNYHAFQGFASKQPQLLGHEVDFTNSNWALPLPSMPLIAGKPDFAIFLCARQPLSDSNDRVHFSLTEIADKKEVRTSILEDAGGGVSRYRLTVANGTTINNFATTTWPRTTNQSYLLGLEWDNARSSDLGYARHRLNGSVAASMTTSGVKADTVPTVPIAAHVSSDSTSLALTGYISTMVIMRAADYNANIEKLEGWAAHAWGLTSALPPAHPYKDTPPTV